MKYVIYLVIGLSLFACGNNDKIDLASVNGIWLNKEYYDSIVVHKKPRSSQKLAEHSFIKYPHLNDSTAMIIWNFHEGNTINVSNDEGRIIIGNEELTMQGEVMTWNGVEFQKTSIEDEQLILEELIFSGKYMMENIEVEFHKNGLLTGLDSFTSYSVLVDYFDVALDIDLIKLKEHMKLPEYFHFNFAQDSVIIYKVDCAQYSNDSSECYVRKKGEAVYRLKKLE